MGRLVGVRDVRLRMGLGNRVGGVGGMDGVWGKEGGRRGVCRREFV